MGPLVAILMGAAGVFASIFVLFFLLKTLMPRQAIQLEAWWCRRPKFNDPGNEDTHTRKGIRFETLSTAVVRIRTNVPFRERAEVEKAAAAAPVGKKKAKKQAKNNADLGRGGGGGGAAAAREPVVVLCPDPPNTLESYDLVFKALTEKGIPTLALELPCMGFSYPTGQWDFSINDNAQVVLELLETLGKGPYTLCFPCIAGYVAAACATSMSVKNIVMVQTPSLQEGTKWVEAMDRTKFLRKPWVGQLVNRMMRVSFTKAWFKFCTVRGRSLRFHELEETAVEKLEDGALFSLASCFQYFLRVGGSPEECKTLSADLKAAASGKCQMVVWGLQDRSHRRTKRDSTSEMVGKRGKGPDEVPWIDVPTCGHFPDLEEPARFASLLERLVRPESVEEGSKHEWEQAGGMRPKPAASAAGASGAPAAGGAGAAGGKGKEPARPKVEMDGDVEDIDDDE